MKKILTVIIAGVLAISLTGCGSKTTQPAPIPVTAPAVQTQQQNDEDEIKSVGEKFIRAYVTYDSQTTASQGMELLTPDFRKTAEAERDMNIRLMKEAQGTTEITKFNVEHVTIDSSESGQIVYSVTAKVKENGKADYEGSEKGTLNFQKINGKWLVSNLTN